MKEDLVDLLIGDTIVSYDFPFNKEFYRVGVIESFVDNFMVCRTVEANLPEDLDTEDEVFATKLFGYGPFDEDFDRIVFVKHATTH